MAKTKFEVDIVIIGGGPASLALLCNSARQNKLVTIKINTFLDLVN